jgi:hypothetical protein
LDEPPLCVVPADLLSLLQILAGGPEDSLQIGISNVALSVVNQNFSLLTASEIAGLKALLLACISRAQHEKSMERFADTVIDTYKRTGQDWPELIDFIFDPHNRNCVIGYLFVRFMGTVKAVFYEAHKPEIMGLVTDLLPICPIAVQTGLLLILSGVADRSDFEDSPELFDLAWGCALSVASDKNRVSKLIAGLTELFAKASHIERTPAPVAAVLDSLATLDSARPLLRLVRYLPTAPIRALLDGLQQLADAAELHLEICDAVYSEACASDPPEAIFKELSLVYKEQSEEDSALALWAPLAAVASDHDILDEIVNPHSPLRLRIALKACEYMANENVSLDFEPSEDVLDTVLVLLHDSMPALRAAAFSCLAALIRNDVFVDPEYVEHLFDTFPDLLPDDYPPFFELLSILAHVDDLDHIALGAVFDFAYLNLRVHGRLVRDSLRVLRWVADADEDLVKCVVDDLVPFAVALLESADERDFAVAVKSLLLYLSLEPEAVVPFVDLPRLLEIADGGQNERVRGSAAVLFAALESRTDREESVRIIEEFVREGSPALIKSAGQIGRFFCRNPRVYYALSKVAASIRDSKVLDTVLVALRQCLKAGVPDCDGVALARLFLSGAHPIFNRKPPAAFHNRKSQIYRFLSRVRIPEVEETLMHWFESAPFPMMGSHLEAISKLTLSPALYARWVNIFTRKMANSTPFLNEIMLGFVMKIVKDDQSTIDIDFLVSQLTYFLEEVADEELGWRDALGTAILELCALGAEMDEEVIKEVLSGYPFAAEFGKTRRATIALIAMVNSGEWDDIRAAVAVSFAQVLTMSRAQLSDHDVGSELHAAMLEMTEQIFGQDRLIRTAARDALDGKAVRVRRFAALFGEEAAE